MIFALTLIACAPDDVTDETKDTSTDTAGDTSEEQEGPGDLSGAWVSEGDDISALFQTSFFDYTRIDATFNTDGTYVVTALNGAGATTDFTGAFTVDATTNPGTIVLAQTAPSAAESQGIWQVVDDVLTYEVVQTTPDFGYVPPTPESGFGTTSGPNITAGVNVQIYRRP